MRLIRISTDLELSVHEFPEGGYRSQNQKLRELIGNGCTCYEHVRPDRLYTKLGMLPYPGKLPGEGVSMLVDGEGLLKENSVNMVGSYLYKTDQHGSPIMGNVLFVGERYVDRGIEFCGIEDGTFSRLYRELANMVLAMKATIGIHAYKETGFMQGYGGQADDGM